ncbi:major facilitator superfamily domain-containing protein [Microdochium trichocladiopsis]|uniref:Major facilitator superfamily domain-containing protein n=1 Tax=Microdochium trichocladiopsis TaxID=1682393 RepID=A0A9P8Y4P6_9PEZI|nr:major facilitator superfamily domain-containing protein [Microdochium trichocladiopsis]KAH7029285.1 major facilitator superfamily domain-containing protein [Microdochium trichocladiopsis]
MARSNNPPDALELEVDDSSDAGEDVAFLQPSHGTRSPPAHARSQKRRGFLSGSRLGDGIITTPKGIAAVLCLAVFLWVMSGMVALIPAMQMIEELFCQRFYGDENPDIHYGDDSYDALCKAEAVQSAMAYVGGVTSMLDSIIGVLLAFPFGVLADRARRPIYMLGALGQLLNVTWSLGIFYFSNIFPVELVLLGPLFQICGGGLATAVAVLFAVISDVHKPEDRANWYFFFSLSAQAAVFLGPPFASALMGSFSPWAPLMLSPIFTTAAGLVMLLIPETAQPRKSGQVKAPRIAGDRHTRRQNVHYQQSQEEIDNLLPSSPRRDTDYDGANTEDDESDIWRQIQDKGWLATIKAHCRHQLSEAQTIFRELRQRSVILLLLVFMLTAPLGKGFGQTFVQYVSKRYHKTIEEVGYLFALRGGLTLVIMGGLLPLLSWWLTSSSSSSSSSSASTSAAAATSGRRSTKRRGRAPLSPFARDLLLAQLSALFSLLGFFGLNTPSYNILVGSLAVESLGSGLLPLCRSMITNFTTPARTSSLFTLISIVETIGGLPAGLLLAWLFSEGMKLGGDGGDGDGDGVGGGNAQIWYGLPFIYLGACALAGLLALLFVRPPPPPHPPVHPAPPRRSPTSDSHDNHDDEDCEAGIVPAA